MPLTPNEIPPNSDVWWQALLAALSGGVLTKFFDFYLSGKGKKQTELMALESRLRTDLKSQNEVLHNEIELIRKELDEWKSRYFELLKQYGIKEVELQRTKSELEAYIEENKELKAKLDFTL